jgi:hypothetical protein
MRAEITRNMITLIPESYLEREYIADLKYKTKVVKTDEFNTYVLVDGRHYDPHPDKIRIELRAKK